MLKHLIVLLSLTVHLFAHAEGHDHLHLLGFLHSNAFGIVVVVILGIFALYRYLEKKNV
ncbi:MAG: hypothetical protein IE918_00845 [Campylobacterales bacterium]|nr:hypothetical protein [Campylobacterales bacterium]